MGKRHVLTKSLLGTILVLASCLSTVLPATAAPASMRQCTLPTSGAPTQAATAAQEGFDSAKFAEAMTFAATRLRLNVRIHRNNCLVGAAPQNVLTDDIPWNLMSSTKSVTSMLAGVAVTQGRLAVNAPIGRYLPAGLGDAAHRAITVRDLLTQTSGLRQAIVSEAGPGLLGLDVDAVREAMAQPLVHKPGTYFEYGQYGPTLLAYVVQRAVGEDLQKFAQRELFSPIGISPHDYFWLRDRAGNTYGFANLYMPAKKFALLGLLMENQGSWNGRRIIDPAYIRAAATPTDTNKCYGYLFWANDAPCVGPSIPSRKVFASKPIPGMPTDAYAMVGFLHQNNFIVPSLGLVITWTGVLGDLSLDPQTLLSASPNSELYHNFLRLLSRAFVSPQLPDPGPYKPDFNLSIIPGQFIDPAMLTGSLGLAGRVPPGCNLVGCVGGVPFRGSAQNVQAILGAVTSRLSPR